MNDLTTTTPEWIKQVRALEIEFHKMMADAESRGCNVTATYPFDISDPDEEGRVTFTLSCSIEPPVIPKISEEISRLRVSKVDRTYYPPAAYVPDETGIFAVTNPCAPFKTPKAQP